MHCTRGPNPHFQASRDPALLRCTDASHLFSALEPNLGYPLPEALTVAELCQAGSGYVVDGKLVKFVKVRAQAVRPPFLAAAPLHAPPRLLILAGPASVVHRDVSRAAAAVRDSGRRRGAAPLQNAPLLDR